MQKTADDRLTRYVTGGSGLKNNMEINSVVQGAESPLQGNKAKKRIVYFDVLNILAALSVIFLHCNGIAHIFSDTLAWRQALAVEVLCFWAVPVFLMLSGATLMGYRKSYSTAEFFKRRFLRAAVPFVIWSLIMAAIKGINPLEIGKRAFIDSMFFSRMEGVYWFFIPLFAVYVSMPVLSLLKDNKKILWYMAGGAFTLHSLLPEIFRYMGLTWNDSLSMLTMGGYLVFPVLGYLLSTTDFSKKQRGVIYLLGIFGAVFRYFITISDSVRDGVLNRALFQYTGWYSIFLAAAVFVFLKYFPLCKKAEKSERAAKILSTVSSCSLGVYLIHHEIILICEKVIGYYGWEWRLFGPFLVYAISLGIVFTVKKIPLIKHIFP